MVLGICFAGDRKCIPQDFWILAYWCARLLVFWMMSEQDLADVVQIAVEDLSPDHPGRAVRQ